MFLLISLISATILLILTSLTFIFDDVAQSNFAFGFFIFSLLVQAGEITKRFFIHTTFEEK